MKILTQLLTNTDASYLQLILTPTEKERFVTNPKFKSLLAQKESTYGLFSTLSYYASTFLFGDRDAKDDNLLYIKVNDSWNGEKYTISALQQLLVQLLEENLIEIDNANRLLETACTVLLLPLSRFVKQDDKIVIVKQETNLTQIVVGKVQENEEFKNLTESQKKQIEDKLNPYFAMLETITPLTAINVLKEMDCNDSYYNSLFRKNKQLHAMITEVYRAREYPVDTFHFTEESRYDCSRYMRQLLNKKILQIALEFDGIASEFALNAKPEAITKLMNILSRSAGYLNNETYYFENKYSEDHASALMYLLKHQSLSPRQALSEIVNINSSQAEALVKLYDAGLRGDHLRAFKDNEENHAYFDYHHRNALSYFIEKRQFSPNKAIAEINGLSEEQIDALMKLSDKGLRGEHLRGWSAGQYSYFRHTQAETLEYLIAEQKVDPAIAVQEINQLTWEACDALQSLYTYGLRGAYLRPLLENFHESHMKSLISLVREQQVPLAIAIDETKQIGNNSWYAETLKKLYSHGLRSKHLLCYKSTDRRDNNFTREHHDALISLIKEQHLSPSEAVEEISCLSEYAAGAVGKLYERGLIGFDLRNWQDGRHEFGYHEQYVLLGLAEKNKEIDIRRIVQRVRLMSSYQIFEMATHRTLDEPASTGLRKSR